ncbi:MAG: LPS export ABC transporter periplasmic protein LptC [Gemmatimonadales bacterium]|nr:MAG: LPS export ABC transporter periplasmic protein LptC [Gemmatimonadales bacterium]
MIFLSLALGVSSCGEDRAASGEAPSIFSGGADQVMFGVEHYMTLDGIRRAKLVADTAYTYEDASVVDFRHLQINFFDDAGNERGTLTSDSGEYDPESGDMTVYGDVVLNGRMQASARARLETDSLAFEALSNELTTDASWILTHEDGTVERGVGLITDPALENIETRDWSVSRPNVEVPM